jgi:hypothetical protein
MPAKPSSAEIALPRGWPSSVKMVLLRVIGLAQRSRLAAGGTQMIIRVYGATGWKVYRRIGGQRIT